MIKVLKGENTYILNNAVILEPIITEILNGSYTLEFKIPTFADVGNLKIDDLLQVNNIYGEQEQFRISQIDREMGFISVLAYQKSYDLNDNIIEDIYIRGLGPDAALKKIQDGCKYSHPFTLQADFSGVIASSRLVRINPIKAILSTEENSFINRWGGEIIRHNNLITMVSKRGDNTGVVIRHKKNLLGYEATIDATGIITSLQPMGANELQLPKEERFIASPLVDNYANPKTGIIVYDDIKELNPENPEEGGYPLPECYKLLKERAKEEFKVNKIDLPKCHYTVNFVDLSKTEEYKEFKNLETVFIGDTVKIVHPEDNLEIEARVISYQYNPITEQYLEIELGNYSPNFTDIRTEISNINNKIDVDITKALEDAKETASNLINNGFGGYVKIYPDRILIMNNEEEAAAKNVWQWNKNGFGFSKTGVNGEYGLAMTMDGSIVADFITTGNLNANVIQSGHILGGNFDLDLDAGLMRFGKGSIDSNTLSPEVKEEIKGKDGKDGKDGLPGLNGKDGLPGLNGKDGESSYTHIAYADSVNGDGFSQSSSNKKYIGMYVDNKKEDSNDPNKYNWTKFVGADGINGIPGKPGIDGKTSYLHIAYADSVNGNGFSQSPKNKKYMGQYTDFIKIDSNDPKKYKWSLIKGADGKDGLPGLNGKDGLPGLNGKDGESSFTHIAYADSVNGNGFSQSSSNKKYIGMYVDNKKEDSNDPNKYNWTKFVGADGINGIPGKPGADGKTPYLHIAYADVAYLKAEDGSIILEGRGFIKSNIYAINKACIGQYTDFIKEDSSDPYRYLWTYVKGKDGLNGKDGKDGSLEELPKWLKEWDSNKTEITGDYVISPNLVVGKKETNGKFTGITVLQKSLNIPGVNNNQFDKTNHGITGYRDGGQFFRMEANGNGFLGDPNGRKIMWSATLGMLEIPKIRTEDLEAKAITADKIETGTITAKQIDSHTITATEINAQSIAAATGKFIEITTDKLIPGTNRRIVLEQGFNSGENNCLSIDTNDTAIGNSIRLKANSGTYVQVNKSNNISFYINAKKRATITEYTMNAKALSGRINELDVYGEMDVRKRSLFEKDLNCWGTITAPVISQTSDSTLKENIRTIKEEPSKTTLRKTDLEMPIIRPKDVMEFVHNARLYTYSYKGTDLTNLTIMANQIKGPLKNILVSKEDKHSPAKINVNSIVGTLHLALQEEHKLGIKRQERIEELELKVFKMEEEIKNIKELLKNGN